MPSISALSRIFRVVALITALPVVLVVVLLLLLTGGAVVSVVGSGTAGVPAGVVVEPPTVTPVISRYWVSTQPFRGM